MTRCWALVTVALISCSSRERMESVPGLGGGTSGEPHGYEDVGEEDGGCSHGALYYGPVALPAAAVGEYYDVDLLSYSESRWRGEGYTWSSGPEWLELEGTRVSGTPQATGQYEFTVDALQGVASDGCSIHPDPHAFTLWVGSGSVFTGSDGGESSGSSDGEGSSSTGEGDS